MFVGEDDTLSDPVDTRALAEQLGEETVVEYNLLKDFTHFSFLLPKDDNASFMDKIEGWVTKMNPVEPETEEL